MVQTRETSNINSFLFQLSLDKTVIKIKLVLLKADIKKKPTTTT
jgi:hypothetical protein